MFVEERFPLTQAYQSQGGPLFQTSVVSNTAGFEARAAQWEAERAVWQVAEVHRTDSETEALIAFFLAVAKGRANGFRFHDFGAGEDTGTDEFLGYGDGETTTYQVQRWYLLGDEAYAKPLFKLHEGVVVTVDGEPLEACTVDLTTGLVTCEAPPPADAEVRASCTYDVPVRLGNDWLQLRCVQTGITSWEPIELLEIRDVV